MKFSGASVSLFNPSPPGWAAPPGPRSTTRPLPTPGPLLRPPRVLRSVSLQGSFSCVCRPLVSWTISHSSDGSRTYSRPGGPYPLPGRLLWATRSSAFRKLSAVAEPGILFSAWAGATGPPGGEALAGLGGEETGRPNAWWSVMFCLSLFYLFKKEIAIEKFVNSFQK